MTFGSQSTADEVLANVDLRGKRVLITGTSSGLGVETARALQACGADVVGAVRDLDKAKARMAALESAGPAAGTFDLVELDLSSLTSVRRCADTLLADGRPFDLVIANAGVMATPFDRTVDGFEVQFGTNHLGHFVLVNRLAPLLARGSRLVILSSAGHRYGDVDLEDPNFERTAYDPWTAYSRSKTANILFAVEFDRRHRESGIRATAVHPGVIQTELSRHMSPDVEAAQIAAINKTNAEAGLPDFEYKAVSQGAATSVWAAVVADADLIGGRYCEDCHVAETNDQPGLVGGVQPYAVDAERALALWARSEELVGESFAAETALASPSRRKLLMSGLATAGLIAAAPVLTKTTAASAASAPSNIFQGEKTMATITVEDGTEIFYKDWGSGQPIVFHHGWPLSGDDWDAQMMFFSANGFRVVAHDRRGHGRSSPSSNGNDMDTYAADVAAVTAHLGLRDAVHVGHSTGGGEVARYVARYGGGGRIAKAVLIGAIPPILLQSATNPEGVPADVVDGIRKAVASNRADFYRSFPTGPFYGFNRPGVTASQAIIDNWFRQGMAGDIKAQYDCITAFSETDFTADLESITQPVLVMHGEDDQIAPIDGTARKAVKLLKNGVLKTYPGYPHGMATTQADVINADILTFIRG